MPYRYVTTHMAQRYRLTVFRQGRIIWTILAFSIAVPGSLYFALYLPTLSLKLLAPALSLTIVFLVAYSAIGKLDAIIEDDTILFRWIRKPILNRPDIAPVRISDVRTLVIDRNEGDPLGNTMFLRRIDTTDRSIELFTSKLWAMDSQRFIEDLKRHSNPEIIDTWEVWKRRGYLGVIYTVMSIMVFAGPLLLFWPLLTNNLDKLQLSSGLYFFGSYLTVLAYWISLRTRKGW